MFPHEEDTAVEAQIDANEQNDQTSASFSPDMIEERIKASLEPLHPQISAVTEMMDRLIQRYSARKNTTASTCELRLQSETPFAQASGILRFPPVAPLATTGYSLDSGTFGNGHFQLTSKRKKTHALSG